MREDIYNHTADKRLVHSYIKNFKKTIIRKQKKSQLKMGKNFEYTFYQRRDMDGK